jgi:hypothetical protein
MKVMLRPSESLTTASIKRNSHQLSLCSDIDIMPNHSPRQPTCGEATNMASTYPGNDASFDLQPWGDGGVWENVRMAGFGFAMDQADGFA